MQDVLNPKGTSLEEKERAYFTMVTIMRHDYVIRKHALEENLLKSAF